MENNKIRISYSKSPMLLNNKTKLIKKALDNIVITFYIPVLL